MKNSGTLNIVAQGDRELVMTRVFDAPRDLVWDAMTRPELLKQWLGVFGGWSLVVCEVDLRPGGTYRYVWQKQDTTMGMRGSYLEVVRPERIVSTEVFDESWYPGEAVGTLVLEEKAGRTTITTTVRYATTEARDGVLESGMRHGVEAGYDRLEEILATMGSRG